MLILQHDRGALSSGRAAGNFDKRTVQLVLKKQLVLKDRSSGRVARLAHGLMFLGGAIAVAEGEGSNYSNLQNARFLDFPRELCKRAFFWIVNVG